MPETEEQTTQQVEAPKPAEGVTPVVPATEPKKEEYSSPLKKTIKQYAKEAQDTDKIDTSFWKDLDDRDYEEADKLTQDLSVKKRFLEVKNDMKKNQRLASERQRLIDEQKSKAPVVQEDPEAVKVKEFVSEMRKDFWGALKNKGKEFELPDPEIIQEQMKKGGAVEDRLTSFQKTELTAHIQKKFNISPEEFVYDPHEAHKAGTPSYEWRMLTEKKEKEIAEEYDKHQKSVTEFTEKVNKQRESDIQFIKNQYHGSNEQEFTENMSKLDEMWREFQSNHDFEKNPLGLKVVYRGVFFEQLTQKAVDEAVNKIHQEYEKKGMFLSDRPGVSVAATKVKGGYVPQAPVEEKTFSPLKRSINRIARS